MASNDGAAALNWGDVDPDTPAEQLSQAVAPAAASPSSPVAAAAVADPAVEALAQEVAGVELQAAAGAAEEAEEAESKDEEEPAAASAEDQAAAQEQAARRKYQGPQADEYQAAATWDSLGLSEALQQAVYSLGFDEPSRIQAQAIPIILRRDRPNVIGTAITGSGKTAAFGLGMLMHVDTGLAQPQGLVLAPTAELASDIRVEIERLGQFMQPPLRVFEATPDSGNAPVTAQVVVGTAGTVISKMEKGLLKPGRISTLVLDEADKMVVGAGDVAGRGQRGAPGPHGRRGGAYGRGGGRGGRGGGGGGGGRQESMGAQVMIIRNQLPKQCQVLLFSATFRQEVRKFAVELCPNAEKLIGESEVARVVKQFALHCGSDQHKYEVLKQLYRSDVPLGFSIIFCNKIETAKALAAKMVQDNFQLHLLHGRGLAAAERKKVWSEFKSGVVTTLVTTDVVARGVNVPQVNLVVNWDVPESIHARGPADDAEEVFLHRIGRAGRFGKTSVAITMTQDPGSKASVMSLDQRYQLNLNNIDVGKELDTAQLKKAFE